MSRRAQIRGSTWAALRTLTNLRCNAVPPRLGSESKTTMPYMDLSLFGADDVQLNDERAHCESLVVFLAALVGDGFVVWARNSFLGRIKVRWIFSKRFVYHVHKGRRKK